MSPLFNAGDAVWVVSLKQLGVVINYSRNGTYKIAIGSVSLSCYSADLSPAQPASKGTTSGISLPRPLVRSSVSTLIDLHGLTVADATSQLERWLNEAILAKHSHLKVVHGLGTGKLQSATHQVLERYSAVRAFRVHDANPGETDVYIG